jgi:hypothetical protein
MDYENLVCKQRGQGQHLKRFEYSRVDGFVLGRQSAGHRLPERAMPTSAVVHPFGDVLELVIATHKEHARRVHDFQREEAAHNLPKSTRKMLISLKKGAYKSST